MVYAAEPDSVGIDVLLCGPGQQARVLRGVPESARANLRNGVVAIPVVDAPQVTTVIAWPPQRRSKAVADLVRTASRL